MHHLSLCSRRRSPISRVVRGCQDLVRFFALLELNHMLHRLCGPPSIPLSFSLAAVLPGGVLNALTSALKGGNPLTLSTHRLRRGLPGYLILFAPHAFAPQCQLQTRKSPSPLVFLHISTHFTATHGIPLSSSALKSPSFQ